jgi:hypothetical protein
MYNQTIALEIARINWYAESKLNYVAVGNGSYVVFDMASGGAERLFTGNEHEVMTALGGFTTLLLRSKVAQVRPTFPPDVTDD